MNELENLQQGLRHLDRVLHNMTFKQVREVLSNKLPRVPITITNFDNSPLFFNQREYGGLNMVYRARPNLSGSTWTASTYMSKKDLSYVPSEWLHKVDYGRVNKSHEAIFYGAFNPSTAAIEVLYSNSDFIANQSTFITVGIWQFKQPLILADIPLSKNQHDYLYKKLIDVKGFTSKFDEAYFEKQLQRQATFGLSDLESCVLDYISDKFCESKEGDNHYKISNYYADRAFDRYPEHPMLEGGVEGILYSSVAGAYQNRCIALLPEAVDSKLTFVGAQLVWVVISDGKFNCNQIDEASADKDGNLHWEKGR